MASTTVQGGEVMIAPEPRYQCYKCEEELIFEVKVGRLDTCPNCEAYLHSCRNCRFWSPTAHNQCLENQGEYIRDREAGNFCGHFQFRRMAEEIGDEAQQAKSHLDSLFGASNTPSAPPSWSVPSGSSSEDQARAKLEDLFKK